MTAILVTGGAGYVGAHACKALAAAGFTPVVYDNRSRGHAEFVRWGPFEQGDVLDTTRLTAVMRHHKPAAVLHFAAFAYIEESFERAASYYALNVGGPASIV